MEQEEQPLAEWAVEIPQQSPPDAISEWEQEYPPLSWLEEGPQLPSTYTQEHVRDAIRLQEYYVVGSRILEGSTISENMRARIRSFLMSEASKQWVMRDTLALACTLVDLYFLHGGFSQVEEFQSLAIGCLILAMKIQEGKFPTISFNVFSKEELLNWQKKIAKRLSFRLTPPTYVTFAERVVMKWEEFTSKDSTFCLTVLAIDKGINYSLRRFYQQLDCVFMVMKSLEWPLESVVVNLFYLLMRTSLLAEVPDYDNFTPEQFVAHFYSADDFRIYFDTFLEFYSSSNPALALDYSLGGYLRYFLILQPSSKVFALKQCVEDLRVWDKLQTFPKDCYSLCKSIIEKLAKKK